MKKVSNLMNTLFKGTIATVAAAGIFATEGLVGKPLEQRVAEAKAVDFMWDGPASGPADGFRIYCGNKSGGPYSLVANIADPNVRLVSVGLPDEETFYCVATTYADIDSSKIMESEYSNQVIVDKTQSSTPPSSISSPLEIKLVGVQPTSTGAKYTLSWPELTGQPVKNYLVERNQVSCASNAPWQPAGSVSSSILMYTVTMLNKNPTFFQVKAMNGKIILWTYPCTMVGLD